MSGSMNSMESKRRVVAILLTLIMLFPYTVKLLHHHPVNGLAEYQPGGFSEEESVEHPVTCEICSFEYVNALVDEPLKIEVYQYEFSETAPLPVQTLHSLTAIFASLRAPPAHA